VVSSIEKSLSIKEYTLIAFLNIEGAFNNVLPTAITESLTELGVEPPMVRLIHKLLISRMVTATLGTSTQIRLENYYHPSCGISQYIDYCGFWKEEVVRLWHTQTTSPSSLMENIRKHFAIL